MNIDWSKYGFSDVREPTPEGVEQAIRRCKRMHAEAFREVPGVFAGWLRRAAAWIDHRPSGVGRRASKSTGSTGSTVVA